MDNKAQRLSAEDWLLAGGRALATAGASALKVERIARDLGATKGSFYWHFKDLSEYKARILSYWHGRAYGAVVAAAETEGSATDRLYRLAEIAGHDDESFGGAAVEAAIRAWAQSDHTVAHALNEIDAKRLAYTAGLLAELGLTNPDFARIVYGAFVGMGTLSIADGVDNRGALSTLMAAILALQEA